MKHIFLILILCLTGSIFCEEYWIVAELFTHSFSPGGLQARSGLLALENDPDAERFIPIILQCDGENETSNASNRLWLYYFVDCTPFAIFGGQEEVHEFNTGMYGVYSEIYHDLEWQDSPLAIDIIMEPNNIDFTITIEVVAEFPAGNYYMYIVPTVDLGTDYFCSAIYFQPIDFEIDEVGDIMVYDYGLINWGYDNEDITVNVFVQNRSSKLVLQAARIIIDEVSCPVLVDEICFPETEVGMTYQRYLTVYNYSSEVLNLGCYPPDCFSCECYHTIPANSTGEIPICFSPEEAILYRDNMDILTSNDDYPEISLILEGQGVSNSNTEDHPAPSALISSISPNPFNPLTEIKYYLIKDDFVSLNIYNLKGKLIKELINESLTAGDHTIIWNGQNQKNEEVASGVYLLKLKTSSHEEIRKITCLK